MADDHKRVFVVDWSIGFFELHSSCQTEAELFVTMEIWAGIRFEKINL